MMTTLATWKSFVRFGIRISDKQCKQINLFLICLDTVCTMCCVCAISRLRLRVAPKNPTTDEFQFRIIVFLHFNSACANHGASCPSSSQNDKFIIYRMNGTGTYSPWAWTATAHTHQIYLYFSCGEEIMRNIWWNCNDKLLRMHKFVYFKNKFRSRHVVRSCVRYIRH